MTNEYHEQRTIALFYKDKKEKVHISKVDGIFYNGIITDVGSDFFIIQDIKDGERFVFFKELKRVIEKYEEVGR